MTVFIYHFKVMASLHFLVHDYALNMPFCLKSALNWMSQSAKRARSSVGSLTNHGLVRLLIINALLRMPITWLQFIELPSNELTKMLALQSTNIEDIGAIWPNQKENEESIEEQREKADRGSNQVEFAEPAEETKLDQGEDSVNLLVEASYISDQDDDLEEVEEIQEEENLASPALKDFMATLPRRKKTTT